MQKKRIQKEDWMAFWLPLFCMLLIFLIKRIYPFGQESFLRTDLYHQYAPFLREFQAKLQSFAPMSYSFNLGLGVNFTSLFAYYLASPLNFFVFFFPKGLVLEYISYLIVFKIALCGMTASIYFRRHFRKGGFRYFRNYICSFRLYRRVFLECHVAGLSYSFPPYSFRLGRIDGERKTSSIYRESGSVHSL